MNLEAHLANCENGRFGGTNVELVEQMNQWQDDRAKLLKDAIKKLKG